MGRSAPRYHLFCSRENKTFTLFKAGPDAFKSSATMSLRRGYHIGSRIPGTSSGVTPPATAAVYFGTATGTRPSPPPLAMIGRPIGDRSLRASICAISGFEAYMLPILRAPPLIIITIMPAPALSADYAATAMRGR